MDTRMSLLGDSQPAFRIQHTLGVALVSRAVSALAGLD